jgi:hypothetical protein
VDYHALDVFTLCTPPQPLTLSLPPLLAALKEQLAMAYNEDEGDYGDYTDEAGASLDNSFVYDAKPSDDSPVKEDTLL